MRENSETTHRLKQGESKLEIKKRREDRRMRESVDTTERDRGCSLYGGGVTMHGWKDEDAVISVCEWEQHIT